jgi:hypothetical protein
MVVACIPALAAGWSTVWVYKDPGASDRGSPDLTARSDGSGGR